MKSKEIISISKLVITPLLYTIFLISLFAVTTFTIANRALTKQLSREGEQQTTILSRRITGELDHYYTTIKQLDDNLVNTGKLLIANQNSLNNDYLEEIKKIFGVDEILWYSPEGEIIFDANDQIVGWKATIGEPVYTFMTSGLDVFIEDIRGSNVLPGKFKLAYVRADNGYFAQVGYHEERYVEAFKELTFQRILEKTIEEDEHTLYALITDINLISIADTDTEDIGIDYSSDEDYVNVISGERVVTRWFYPQLNKYVLEAAVPLYYQNEIIGIVAIGFSLDTINSTISMIIFSFLVLLISITISFAFFYYHFIYKPSKKLITTIESIQGFNDNTNQFSLLSHEDRYYPGIYQTINKLINKLNHHIEGNKKLQKQTELLAFNDYLTKLPNRFSFIKKVNEIIENNSRFAILFLDLDGFKEYNDTKGHLFGDQILVKISDKLKELASTKIFIARFGGDEFLISIIYNSDQELGDYINKVMSIFDETYIINKQECHIKACVGISKYPEDATNIEELLSRADIAMYQSKNTSKNNYSYFESSMELEIKRKSDVRKILRKAIENDNFKLVFQPIVNLKTNEIKGFEALLRIKDSNIMPGEFIPVAEESGLISSIGKIVVEKAIQQLVDWRNQGLKLKRVFVNVSPMEIKKFEIVDHIKKLLDENNIDAKYFGVEITENTIVQNSDNIIEFLKKLNKIGVKTALDDFGSGQASLHFLTRFHVKSIKLDKKLIDRYLKNDELDILNQIIGLAELMGFETLAEGIETDEQLKLLQSTKCGFAQGYYFYRPLEVDQITEIYNKKLKL